MVDFFATRVNDFFEQLLTFTKDAYTHCKIPMIGTGKNNWGPYEPGEPSGHVLHYTASPNSSFARVKTLMKRFQINSSSRVGVHFIVFDCLHDELAVVRAKYPDLYGPNGALKVDVLHYGLDLAFWASNWANKFTVATEMRNVGKVFPKAGTRQFYWGSARNVGNPKYLYKGRTPVQVRGMYAEPFTDDQMFAAYTICRALKGKYGLQFVDPHFLSHYHIHANKWDAWPHFPFGRMKQAIFGDEPFDLAGYLEQLDKLHCQKVVDRPSAEQFFRVTAYTCPFPLETDFTEAVKMLQTKKGLKATGKLTQATMDAMNTMRAAYKLV